MKDQKFFILAHPEARRRASAFIVNHAPDGYHVVIRPPLKKREQEEKYHAQISDISRQTEYAGRKWGSEDMKRIMVDEFAEEMRLAGTPLHHDGRLIPSENGRRVIQLGIQSSQFYAAEASQFIEFLNSYGAERGVV